MLAFTALLFFRPQDQIPGLEALHLSELTAIAGLAAMAARRMSAGQTIAHVNAEVIGVVALGAIIVLTMPFSIWPGGSTHVFSDIYVKIILIFALMVSTITSPRRVRQMTWIMIVASGYIASRAVFDYVRGVNLVEGDRVRGAVGGMFENPNDLALNLVTFLAPTLFIIFYDRKPSRRLFAGVLAIAMLAAIVCTKSRSGSSGLIGMGAVVLYYSPRPKPAIVVGALVVAGLMALPVMPSSFWNRMDSIVNAEEDQSGSRAARLRLIDQRASRSAFESDHGHRRRPVQELQRAGRHREMARDAQRLAAGGGRARHLRPADFDSWSCGLSPPFAGHVMLLAVAEAASFAAFGMRTAGGAGPQPHTGDVATGVHRRRAPDRWT